MTAPTSDVARNRESLDARPRGATTVTTAPTAARTPTRARPSRPPSEFAELTVTVRNLGLMERRLHAYAWHFAALFGGLVIIGVAMLLIGDSWLQLAVAVALGIVLSQFGFLAHDLAHRQVFASNATNEWASRVMSGAIIGLSYAWWTHKHNRHHRSPNQVDRDPDIAPGGLVFTPDAALRRPQWVRPITTRQGYLFFPMLLLEGASLHIAGIRTLVQRRELPHRALEIALVVVRFAAYALFLSVVMSPGTAVAFAAVQLGVFGFFLGAAFAPNHKGMPVVPRDLNLDFMRRQVLMSRNIRGGWLVDIAMGGLNYQVEHHLFPSMPRANLRRAQPIVREFCESRGITYTETSLVQSYAIVMRYLNEVGIGARDPFTCPFVAANRG